MRRNGCVIDTAVLLSSLLKMVCWSVPWLVLLLFEHNPLRFVKMQGEKSLMHLSTLELNATARLAWQELFLTC